MKKVKICLIFLLSIITLCVLMTTSNAATDDRTPVYGYVFTRGVGNCCYYVDSSASSYTSAIEAAANNWEVTGFGWNPIYMSRVTSNWATHVDFYDVNPSNDTHFSSTTLAYTSFWTSSSNVINNFGAPTQNYFYTEVKLNANKNISGATLRHEFGHAFGLKHYNTNPASIMCQEKYDRTATTVSECDHNAINYLYD